jgi:cytoskeletal protein RodZ
MPAQPRPVAVESLRVAPDDKKNDGAGVDALGRYLLQERELRGLTRADVSGLTKLSPSVIEALESGDPDRIPPRAYLIGYLRSYAVAVGLDPDEVVLRWQEAAGAAPLEKRRRRPGSWRRWVVAGIVLVALTAAIVMALLANR